MAMPSLMGFLQTSLKFPGSLSSCVKWEGWTGKTSSFPYVITLDGSVSSWAMEGLVAAQLKLHHFSD